MPNVVFQSHIDNVLKATNQALARACEIIGGMMETKAKMYITDEVYTNDAKGWYVRTGNLRNSITHDTFEEDGAIVVAVGSTVEYAPYVELGTGVYASDGKGRKTPWRYQDKDGNWHATRGMPPRPYLRPAVENHIRDYRAVLQQELSKP